MLKKFIPDLYLQKVTDLNLQSLQQLNIKFILCDLDNTLAIKKEKIPTLKINNFIQKIKKMNFVFIIVSNNNQKRVKKYASHLGVDFHYLAKKPLLFT